MIVVFTDSRENILYRVSWFVSAAAGFAHAFISLKYLLRSGWAGKVAYIGILVGFMAIVVCALVGLLPKVP